MRIILALLVALVGGVAAAAAQPTCTPLAGAQAVLSRPSIDYILLGEAHGTKELPAVFAELACAAARAGPVTIGLEFLPAEQERLDAYLLSDGGFAARTDLIAGEGWSDQHGRASTAILDLVEALRRMKAEGADLTIVAFDHPSEQPGTSAARERGMAQRLLSAKAARPQARILALTGAGHASKSPWTSFNPPFLAMSQHLPNEATIAVAFERTGGEVWACRPPAEGQAPVCRAWTSTAGDAVKPRGLRLDDARDGYEAVVSPGSAFTASAPIRQAEAAAPR